MRMHLAAWMAAIVLGLGGFSVACAGVWTGGHGDIDVHLDGAALEVGLHFHDPVDQLGGGTIPAGHYEADEHQIFVKGPTQARPSGAAWDFAGLEGDQLWFLPPTGSAASLQGKPYLGWSAEDLPSAQWSNITFTLLSINGPAGGVFSVFSESFGTPTVKLSSTIPLSSFVIGGGNHDHYFVAFNREGTFDVTLKVSATQISSGQAFEGQGTFTFFSGSVPSGAVPEPTSMAIFAMFAVGAGYRMNRRRRLAAV